MDADALRALQAPLKQQYRDEPGAAVVTLTAEGDIDDAGIACKVETGRALVAAGLHPATGGSGLEACSGDMLLEALVACAGVTLKAVATAIGIELALGARARRGRPRLPRHARRRPRGARRLQRHPPDASTSSSDAPQEQLDQLLKLTERYCVVLQTLRSAPPSPRRRSTLTAAPDLEREAVDPLDHDLRADGGAARAARLPALAVDRHLTARDRARARRRPRGRPASARRRSSAGARAGGPR